MISNEGFGIACYPNGDEYWGEICDGMHHGYGVAKSQGQRGIYAGQWVDGQRHGWAVSTLRSGTLWAGQWIYGRASWLADMGLIGDNDLQEDVLEALNLCQEAANHARTAEGRASDGANLILQSEAGGSQDY